MLTKPGTTTHNEILEQPQAWNDVLAVLDEKRAELGAWMKAENFGQVLLVGCGSSYHAGLTAARTFHGIAGVNGIALPASEVLYAQRPPYDIRIKTLLIAVSRSGETSETVWAVEKLKRIDGRLKILAVTCKENSELQGLAHQTLVFPKLHEESVISTRSYTGSLLALQVLAAWLSANDAFLAELKKIPELTDVKKHTTEVQKAVALKPQHVTFLGNGACYGLAAASSLLVREMAGMPSDYMHLLEFRHGPQAAVLPNHMIVAFLSDTLRKAEEDMVREIAVMRGPRMVICSEADNKTKMGTEFVFELGHDLSELARPVREVTIVQLLGFYLAIQRGHNPDRPKHVQALIKLKEKIG
ncbi:MAG: SIS domain-containing protein [Armatimonadetes bacterium]|nr:SIS domain-containing protein [Armatimonadota bacterium]